MNIYLIHVIMQNIQKNRYSRTSSYILTSSHMKDKISVSYNFPKQTDSHFSRMGEKDKRMKYISVSKFSITYFSGIIFIR